MQQVDLGFTKFEVTRQAIVMFVFATILVFLSSAIAIIPLYKAGIVSTGFFVAFAIFFVIIAILYGILGAYAINCMVVGKCIKLSWIFTGLYAFVSVFYFLLFVISIISGKPLPQSPLSKSMSKSK